MADVQEDLVLAFIPADLGADRQMLFLLVEQKDGDVLQMKIVARDCQDSLQHLIQIKGGEYGLARVVQDRYFCHFYPDSTAGETSYRGSESNLCRRQVESSIPVLPPFSRSANQPVGDQAEPEIYHDSQI